MAAHEQEDVVQDNEKICRRVFGDPVFHGESGNAGGEIRLDHFFDNRLESGLSIDRMGLNNISKETRKLLTPVAIADSEQMSKQPEFFGWIAVLAKEIKDAGGRQILVEADPIEGNPMHGLISRECVIAMHPNWQSDKKERKSAARLFAFMMQQSFQEGRKGFERVLPLTA